MRMMKRVAVSILAAAMALSLLTACGGGDAPSAPETPSNPGTSQGEEKKDDSTDSKPEDKKDPPAESTPEDKKDEEVADGSTIEFNKSRTYKWVQEYGSAKKVYIKVEPVKPASQVIVCTESVAYVEGKPKAETFKGQMKQAFENKLWNIIVSSKDQQDKISKFYILNRDFMEFIGFGEEDKNRWEGICKDYNEVLFILTKNEISQRDIDRGKTLLRRHNGLFPKDWNRRLNAMEKVLKDNEKAKPQKPAGPNKTPLLPSTQPGGSSPVEAKATNKPK